MFWLRLEKIYDIYNLLAFNFVANSGCFWLTEKNQITFWKGGTTFIAEQFAKSEIEKKFPMEIIL